MDGSLVWSNRYHQSGTLMPSGAVHPIFARSEATKQSILPLCRNGLLRFARNDSLPLALRQEADHGFGEGVRLFDIGNMRGVENRQSGARNLAADELAAR